MTSPIREHVRRKIHKNPSVMTSSLANELEINEAEIIRHLPEKMWVEAPIEDFKNIWMIMTGWEKVTFIVCNPGAVVEMSGTLPSGNFGHGMFNLMDRSNPLNGHLMIDRLGSIFLVSKPFFTLESHSVQFFDTHGLSMFSIYVGRDEKRTLLPSVKKSFLALRNRYVHRETH